MKSSSPPAVGIDSLVVLGIDTATGRPCNALSAAWRVKIIDFGLAMPEKVV
jgi:hypothetical protein